MYFKEKINKIVEREQKSHLQYSYKPTFLVRDNNVHVPRCDLNLTVIVKTSFAGKVDFFKESFLARWQNLKQIKSTRATLSIITTCLI